MAADPQPGGTSREAFLDRVREALGRSRTQTPSAPPAVDESIARLASESDDTVERFCCAAEAVGMKIHRAPAGTYLDVVTRLMRDEGVRTVVVAMSKFDPDAVATSVRGAGFSVVDWRQSSGLDGQFDVDAGITDVEAALAETGTIVCSTSPVHSRGPSLVPPVHIALVKESDVLPDMIDLWRSRREQTDRRLPSSIALITGPSKTADIEGELVTGVHGPAKVHVVVVASRGA